MLAARSLRLCISDSSALDGLAASVEALQIDRVWSVGVFLKVLQHGPAWHILKVQGHA